MADRSIWDILEARDTEPHSRESLKFLYKRNDTAAVPLADTECRGVDPYEMGIATGRQQSFDECEARVAAITAELELKFQATQRQTAVEVLRALETAFQTASQNVYTEVATAVAAALMPHIKKSAAANAIELLLDAMMKSQPTNAAASCRITGPKDLLALLNAQLNALAPVDREALPQTITIAESHDIDVQVDFDGALLKTTIGTWLSRIDEVLSK